MNTFEEKEYSKKLNFGVWKKVVKFIVPHKRKFIYLCSIMFLVAAIDAFFPILTKYAIDNFVMEKKTDGVLIYSLIVLFTIFVQAVNVRIFILIAGRIETEIPYNMRKELFEKLQGLNVSYFDKTPVGWIVTRITSDIRKLGHTLSWQLVDFSWATMMMILMIIIMSILNFKLALVIIFLVPILVIISLIYQAVILKNTRIIRKNNSYLTNSFSDCILGVKTIKTLVKEDYFLDEFKINTKNYKKSYTRAVSFSASYSPIIMLLGSIGLAVILVNGGYKINNGIITYGTLAAFISYALQFFEPVKTYAHIFTQLQHSQAAIERIDSLLETESEIVDNPDVIKHYGDYKLLKKHNWPKIIGNIDFKNVYFSYKHGESILDNFNLSVEKGEKIALVGETGAGKTTIVNILCRFFEPNKGKILIDGIDYRERSQNWLRSNIGYVLQDPHLFSGTIMNNLKYSNRDISDEEVIKAAKLLKAHDFISKFEKGYNEDVGEGGNKLSKGQKQLISFVRAVVYNPPIIIFDEATSSIDVETEYKIQYAIDRLLRKRTGFIIAHRLSTIRSANRILVLSNGKIIEEGNHKELLNKKGEYYDLYQKQFSNNIEKDNILNEIDTVKI
ncbi:MAG: ABC transporter ATP-binding protein [Clostridiales bacterium]